VCGVVAVSSNGALAWNVEGPLRSLEHRGPDGSGTFSSEGGDCHLGHSRLSILDLSESGAQPMRDSTGRYVISYNGETYNFRELRQYLSRKYDIHGWRSESDTEVIVEGFAREGADFLGRLNGIFALTIYDRHSRTLHVLRDPLGIKPLFVTRQHGAAIFASELKGLRAFPSLAFTRRMQSLADQLSYMYVPEPFTPFEEVRKVEPGTLYAYRSGERISEKALFASLHDPLSLGSDEEIVEGMYEKLSAAVRRQLVSDVPVSLMLSGGLDSSAIAFEVVKSGADVRDAYTISVSDEDRAHDQQGDDLRFARMMADRLGLNLKVIHASSDFTELLPGLIGHLEDGVSDPAAINTYLICKAARETGVKVMLNGQGADEYLCGYRRYLAEQILERVPGLLRRPLSYFNEAIPARVPGRLNAVSRRAKRLLSLASEEPRQRLRGLYTWNSPEVISGLFDVQDGISVGGDLTRHFESLEGLTTVDAMMEVDHRFDLMSLNLTYTDRMSMAAGVEARVPFLDLELVRYMNSIPARLKLKRTTLKYVLKKAMEPYLPRDVIYRPKTGFALPIRAWMREDNAMVRDLLSADRIRRQGLFSPDAVQTMCAEQFSGKREHSNTLFSLLCLQLSLDAPIHRVPDSPSS
jgi:asparagine synthase (glutamine-hydrolysing)